MALWENHPIYLSDNFYLSLKVCVSVPTVMQFSKNRNYVVRVYNEILVLKPFLALGALPNVLLLAKSVLIVLSDMLSILIERRKV